MRLSIIDYFLIGLLILAVYYDIKTKKIPNKITIPAIIIGIIWATVNSGFNGFLIHSFGFLLGFTVFLIPYMLGGMGAGDVKLMAAIGAIKGWKFILLTSLWTALAGGIIVIVVMIYKGGLKNTIINAFGLLIKPIANWILKVSRNKTANKLIQYFENNKLEKGNYYIPYALAIAAGSLIVLFSNMTDLL